METHAVRYWIAGLLLALVCGCGPELSKQDLGQVSYDLPKVAGADEPYKMPQLVKPASDDGAAAKPDEEEKKPAADDLPLLRKPL